MERVIKILISVAAISIFTMVLVGGVVRLSKAGLAITEWKLITGILPPLSQSQWEKEFESYKKIAQYELIHKGITLENFKKIYLIEYFHRLLGRFLGIYIIGVFLYLLVSKGRRFWKLYWGVLTLLIFAQGTVGWLMVRTGVVEPRPFVSPIFLAFHNLFALFIFAYTLWGIHKTDNDLYKTITDNRKLRKIINNLSSNTTGARLRTVLAIGLFVFLLQVFLGTLVAGQKAALIAPTWPDFNGKIIPEGLFINPLDNPVFSNFFHRYLPFVLLIIFVIVLKFDKRWGAILISIWVLQFTLGVFTLINSRGDIPLILGVLHQGVAWIMFFFLFSSFLRAKSS